MRETEQADRKRAIRGQATLEFALGAMAFLFVVMAIIHFAMLYNYKLIIGYASREGARYAAVHGARDPITDDQAKDWMIARAASLNPPLTRADVTITPPKEQRVPDQSVRVRIDYTVSNASAFVPSFIGRDLVLSAQSTMRLE